MGKRKPTSSTVANWRKCCPKTYYEQHIQRSLERPIAQLEVILSGEDVRLGFRLTMAPFSVTSLTMV